MEKSNMIFASDLDQTLIFSKRFLGDRAEEFCPVEEKKDKMVSFMTSGAIEALRQLNSKILFIPVTTRSIEQYKRIFLLSKELKPKYAIVSNGGNLLVNGEIHKEWGKIILGKLKNESLAMDEVLKEFRKIQSQDWIIDHRIADDLFSYCIVDRDKVPYDNLMEFCTWIEANNWRLSLQGRKLYLVPRCICKGTAIEYIKALEECSFVAAAGDSLLDLPMLEMADHAFFPPHGELGRFIQEGGKLSAHIKVTNNQGIFASEEILTRIMKYAI